jgi:hypothetical protein
MESSGSSFGSSGTPTKKPNDSHLRRLKNAGRAVSLSVLADSSGEISPSLSFKSSSRIRSIAPYQFASVTDALKNLESKESKKSHHRRSKSEEVRPTWDVHGDYDQLTFDYEGWYNGKIK